MRVQDTSGATLSIPKSLTPKVEASPNGRDFFSREGTALFAVRHYNSRRSIQDLFQDLRTALASTKILYSVARPDWFVLAGGHDGHSYYFRFFRVETGVQGFYAVYDTSRISTFSPIIVMTSLTFQPMLRPTAVARATPLVDAIPIDGRLQKSLFKDDAQDTSAIAPPSDRPREDILSPRTPLVRGPSIESVVKANAGIIETNAGAEASKLLLDSVELLMEKSANKSIRTFRYSVDKSILPDFAEDMPLLRVVFNEKVFFDTDKSNVRNDALATLDTVARNAPAQ